MSFETTPLDRSAPWVMIAETAQQRRQSKIPKEWLLPTTLLPKTQQNITHIPENCGILSTSEMEMTSVEDATLLLSRIHAKEWLAEDVMRAFCKRAAISHQLVNCLTEIRFEEALTQARELDRQLREDNKLVGPLHGLPISIKDHVNVAGLRSTSGYCFLAENVPEKNAVIVEALVRAGAIVFVKTTIPLTGMIFETVSNLWGRTTSPYNRLLTSGGSSGGEGALLGLRGSPVGLGSDIGGSLRVPAAFNGIYTLRPSSRRLSFSGITSISKGNNGIMPVVGPMGRSIRDLELLCKIATDACPWEEDISVIRLPWQPPPRFERPLVIGIMKSDGVVRPHPPILRALDEAETLLRKAGHEVLEFTPHEHERCWEITYGLYTVLAGKGMGAALERTGEPWPVAAKKFSANPDLHQLSVPELFALNAARDAYKMEYLKHWQSTQKQSKSGRTIDALLCPAAASTSFPHDYLPWWGYTSQFNLLDYPAVVLPVGFVDKEKDVKDPGYVPISARDRENHDLYEPEMYHGVPVGLQLVGMTLEDEKLLGVASQLDEIFKSSK